MTDKADKADGVKDIENGIAAALVTDDKEADAGI
jgi:hypothetical protein